MPIPNTMFSNRSIKSKLLSSFATMAALVCITGAVGAWFTFSISERAEVIGAHLGPISEAALETKLSGTEAHLVFEEIMAGDETESINQVWSLLERASWFADAVVKGGEGNGALIQPTQSEIVREKMTGVVKTLQEFRQVADERVALRDNAKSQGNNSAIELERLYQDMVAKFGSDAHTDQDQVSVTPQVADAARESKDALASTLASAYILALENSGKADKEVLEKFKSLTSEALKLSNEIKSRQPTGEFASLPESVVAFEAAATRQLGARANDGSAGSAIETRFDDLYEQFVALASEARAQIDLERKTYLKDADNYRKYATFILMSVLISAALFAAIMGQLIGRNISRRVIGLSDLMKASANNRTDTVNHLANDKDEIGEMARSLEYFRSAIADKERVEAAAQKAREDDERRNRELESSFQSDLSTIIDSASAGDFSKRVDTSARSGLAFKISDGMNKLVGTVDGALKGIRDTISGLAKGDLTRRVEGEYSGVFLDLKNDTNTMADKFRAITRRISASTHEVQNATREIFSGVSDLSVRTEHQASSLEETAASMEEISATVRQNADNAMELKSVADAARNVAENGNSIVNNAVASMTAIDASSQQISEIVGLIQDIAFQTNILALNAAVEAARAGEAGKGFAVVANEVRTLAQRAGQASKDIRILIHASESRVKDGVTHVRAAGASLAEILGSVNKVADLVSNIASATQEQSAGIDQVSKAVGGMDQMTQQNAALVEETNAALRSTQGQLEELRKAVDFFKFETGEKAAPGANAETLQPEPTMPVREQFQALAKRVSSFRTQPHSSANAYKLEDWKEF